VNTDWLFVEGIIIIITIIITKLTSIIMYDRLGKHIILYYTKTIKMNLFEKLLYQRTTDIVKGESSICTANLKI
jgi:hypothetical protein